MLTEVEWAWLAGLFEGEGTISLHPRKGVRKTRWYIAVRIRMTDLDIIERVNSLFPAPNGILTHEYPDSRKTLYGWNVCSKQQVKDFLEGVLPWLGDRRRAKALEALTAVADLC